MDQSGNRPKVDSRLADQAPASESPANRPRIVKATVLTILALPITVFTFFANFYFTCGALSSNHSQYSLETMIRISLISSIVIAGGVFIFMLCQIHNSLNPPPNAATDLKTKRDESAP